MPTTLAGNRDPLHTLMNLPKDKDVLDFIWSKMSKTCGPEKSEMLRELLEMHRTSNGFDPMELSKGRVNRIKASEYKKMLIEINASLQGLIHTEEYKELMRSRK